MDHILNKLSKFVALNDAIDSVGFDLQELADYYVTEFEYTEQEAIAEISYYLNLINRMK